MYNKTNKSMKNARNVMKVIAIAFGLLACANSSFGLDPSQSGQVVQGNNIVESAYDTADGSVAYILTHEGTPESDPVNKQAVSPLYIVVYPTEVSGTIGTVNCQHQPMDNCPTHGPVFAGLAKAMVPSVYGNGVWGHDHIGAFSAGRGNGGNFNVAWVPVAVLFKTADAATNHITTLQQLQAAEKANQVTEVWLWDAVFQGSSVSGTVYNNGTPITPAPPTP